MRVRVLSVYLRFYSKLVRLKGTAVTALSLSISRFYSKLVRLKGIPTITAGTEEIKFLFQIGTIKSTDKKNNNDARTQVSIPNWYD